GEVALDDVTGPLDAEVDHRPRLDRRCLHGLGALQAGEERVELPAALRVRTGAEVVPHGQTQGQTDSESHGTVIPRGRGPRTSEAGAAPQEASSSAASRPAAA